MTPCLRRACEYKIEPPPWGILPDTNKLLNKQRASERLSTNFVIPSRKISITEMAQTSSICRLCAQRSSQTIQPSPSHPCHPKSVPAQARTYTSISRCRSTVINRAPSAGFCRRQSRIQYPWASNLALWTRMLLVVWVNVRTVFVEALQVLRTLGAGCEDGGAN